MFASIVPIIRLPRRFGVFDYVIPSELEDRISMGSLVSVSFRQKIIFGLVWDIKKTAETESSLKPIVALAHDQPLLLIAQRQMLQTIARWYGLSLATAAKLFLPPLQIRKIARLKLAPEPIQRKKALGQPIYHLYRNHLERQACLAHAVAGTTLILVPTVADIETVLSALKSRPKDVVGQFHSGLTNKEQFSVWSKIRNNELSIIIGTRGAIFLPFLKLQSIIIDLEHDENHKHWDQAPRFQAKDLAEELARLFQAQLHYMSFSPSCESYHRVYKKKYALCSGEALTPKVQWLKRSNELPRPRIIDMRDERRGKNYSLFSDAARQALLEAKEDVFIFINRLGFAASVDCKDCGFVIHCQTCELPLAYHDGKKLLRCHYCNRSAEMIATCPQCRSPLVQLRGVGTELVEKEVRQLFSHDSSHDIIRIDRETKGRFTHSEQPAIIIGTDMAWPFVRWAHTSAIIFLEIDKQLSRPEYAVVESVWHALARVEYNRSKTSEFLIQTFHPEHTVFRSLLEPDRIYRIELSARQALSYPPYVYLARYLCGQADASVAEREAKRVYREIKSALTNQPNQATLLPPIETHPPWHRGKYWYALIAKLPPESWPQTLIKLNQSFGDFWKIDPNPINLLQP